MQGGKVVLSLVALSTSMPAASQFPTEDLSVREVLIPRLFEPGGFSNFSPASPRGDVDGNGQADFLVFEGVFDAQGLLPRAKIGWSLGASANGDREQMYGEPPGLDSSFSFHRSVFLKRDQDYFVYWAD
jgi:hypothetical protein